MKLGPRGFGDSMGFNSHGFSLVTEFRLNTRRMITWVRWSYFIKYTNLVFAWKTVMYLQGQVLVPAGASGLQKFADGEAFCPLRIWAKTLTTSTNMLNTCPVHSCAWKKCSCWTDNSSRLPQVLLTQTPKLCFWPKKPRERFSGGDGNASGTHF